MPLEYQVAQQASAYTRFRHHYLAEIAPEQHWVLAHFDHAALEPY